MIRRVCAAFVFSFSVLASLAAFALLPAGCKSRIASPPPRQVVLYCSADQDVAEPIIEEFQRQTGIRVLARFDTEASKTVGLTRKLKAEAASPVADVFWSNDTFHTIALARDNLLAQHQSPAVENWPPKYRDADRRWYGFAARARAIAYSTKRVAAADAPNRLEDMLDARWNGRIVMASPEFGTTGGDVASWFAHYGPSRGREILQRLKANNVRIVDSNSTAVRLVATGEVDVAMTDTDDVYAAQRNNQPVAMNFLDQGGKGTLTIPNTVAIVKGAPQPDEAARLLEFLLSAGVEETLARSDAHNTPIRPEVAAGFPKYAIPKPLEIDYEKVADQLRAAVQASAEILK